MISSGRANQSMTTTTSSSNAVLSKTVASSAPLSDTGSSSSLSITPPRGLASAAGLALLNEAHDYAQDLGCDVWDFAVEVATLHNAGISNSMLRWMVRKAFVQHGREITLTGEHGRSFRPGRDLTFHRKTCFVPTKTGYAFIRGQLEQISQTQRSDHQQIVRDEIVCSTPEWDRDRQELRLGQKIIKQFKVRAGNQEAILAAFQEEGWPVRIDDPLSPRPDMESKRRLHDTINSLNRNQKEFLIRFAGDGTGQGIRWELAGRAGGSHRNGKHAKASPAEQHPVAV